MDFYHTPVAVWVNSAPQPKRWGPRAHRGTDSVKKEPAQCSNAELWRFLSLSLNKQLNISGVNGDLRRHDAYVTVTLVRLIGNTFSTLGYVKYMLKITEYFRWYFSSIKQYHTNCVGHWHTATMLNRYVVLHIVSTWSSMSTWWRHQMEIFSALLAIYAGNSPVTSEFPAQRPVTRSFDIFFDLRLNKRLSKQSWGWWYETPSRWSWRHCNAMSVIFHCLRHLLYAAHGSRICL